MVSKLKKDEKENAARYPDAIFPSKNSFERFDIPSNLIKRNIDKGRVNIPLKVLRLIIGSRNGIKKSLATLHKNPKEFRREISPQELEELEAYIKSQGVTSIGYTKLKSDYVFQNMSVLHDNVIVMTMEMRHEKMKTSPSPAAFEEVHRKYYELGDASNKVAHWLRKKGFSCQAVPPLNGVVLFPPLAESAGLGYHGIHGLIITPEHGPRVRLATVTTSIENLPFGAEQHHWINDYCQKCQICVKKCPTQAISVEPILHPGGLMTHVDENKCFPYFADEYGCSICLAVCPFSFQEFDQLQKISQR